MPAAPVLLARGPWSADEIEVRWSDEHFAAPPERVVAADAAIAALRDRGSPSHDGLAARLVEHAQDGDGRLSVAEQLARFEHRVADGLDDDGQVELAVLEQLQQRARAGLAKGQRDPGMATRKGGQGARQAEGMQAFDGVTAIA